MMRRLDRPGLALVALAILALARALLALAERGHLGALYWAVLGGLALEAARDREHRRVAR
jgi:hypothetical protein